VSGLQGDLSTGQAGEQEREDPQKEGAGMKALKIAAIVSAIYTLIAGYVVYRTLTYVPWRHR